MTTLYYHHPDFLRHDTSAGHPESPQRLKSIEQALAVPVFKNLVRVSAAMDKSVEQKLKLIHQPAMIERVLKQKVAEDSYFPMDYDTILSAGSAQAALLAVSAACEAVDKICTKQAQNAFCAVRPPGHHATPEHSMGFCLFNNIAIAAAYALEKYGLKRVAIVDFDVHHGNGTQAAFEKNPQVFYASSHEMPHYPHTGRPQEKGVGNILNVPLQHGETGDSVRKKYSALILPALRKFNPQLLLISAGFDAHKDDPLGSIQLVEDDYRWLTEELMLVAKDCCEGKIVSLLEGGYNLNALGKSVAAHVKTLMKN